MAIQDFTHVIEMTVPVGAEPQIGDAYYARGYVYYMQGDTEEAIRDFNLALKSNGGSAEISNYSLLRSYFLKGLIELNKKELNSALQDCTKAKAFAFNIKGHFS